MIKVFETEGYYYCTRNNTESTLKYNSLERLLEYGSFYRVKAINSERDVLLLELNLNAMPLLHVLKDSNPELFL